MSGERSTLTCLVTGANSGVGFAASRALAREGHRVLMACRSRERAEAARERIREEHPGAELPIVLGDLAVLDDVRTVAETVLAGEERLDAVVANAGLYRADFRRTVDGFEETMAVNHLAHFLLVGLLLPALREAGGRVVVLSSEAHRRARLEREPLEVLLREPDDYDGFQAYCDAKLANLLFALELARREEPAEVTVNALHPGMLATRIWNRNTNFLSLLLRLFKPFMGDPAEGGEPAARLVTAPELEGVTGRYFDQEEPVEPSGAARDRALAEELWRVSEEAVALPS